MKSMALMSDIFAILLLLALINEGKDPSVEDSKEASLESDSSQEAKEKRIEVTVSAKGSYIVSGKSLTSLNALSKYLEQKNITTVALQFNNQATLHQHALQLTEKLSSKFKIKYIWEKTNEKQ